MEVRDGAASLIEAAPCYFKSALEHRRIDRCRVNPRIDRCRVNPLIEL